MFDAERIKNDIIDWIKTYFDENGKNCTAVLGISGGKDSSIAAALCAQAIGADRVLGVLMPQGEQRDIVTAYEVGDFLKIRHIVVNIANTVDTLSGDLQQSGI
ncbi:MAG: NAD(+) synthase, partial [Oscillospiraceae bacterium]|nr:NAD(+) synthase [Oscillospiraceae bacterium]